MVGVAAVALAVRGAYLASVAGAAFQNHLVTEPARYDAWARAIAAGHAPFHPPFDEAPGYPYAVAALYALGGGLPVVRAVQALVDAASAALVADLARATVSLRAGWAAGLVAALYAPSVYFTGQLEPATLAVFAVAVALRATPPAAASWGVAGVAWAFAVVVRSELVFTWPIVVAHAAWTGGRGAAARMAAAPAVLLALSLGANLATSGAPVPLTIGAGFNAWIGCDGDADGVNPFLSGRRAETVQQIERTAPDAPSADLAFGRLALARVAHAPAAVARLAVRKVAWTFTAVELPNAGDIAWETGHSWVLRYGIAPFGLGVLLPLAGAGVALARRADRVPWVAMAAPIAAVVVTGAAFFVNARFRMPMVPSLCLLAGLGVDRAAGALAVALSRADGATDAGRAARRDLGRGLVGVAVGVALAWNGLDGVRAYRLPEIDMNTAALALAEGDVDGGLARLAAAVHARPADPAGWYQLATELERAGRVDDARSTWVQALVTLPSERALKVEAARFARRHPDE